MSMIYDDNTVNKTIWKLIYSTYFHKKREFVSFILTSKAVLECMEGRACSQYDTVWVGYNIVAWIFLYISCKNDWLY